MTADSQPPTSPSNNPSPATPPPKKKKRWLRRIVLLLVILIVFIGLLVLLAPTLVGTAPVRGLIVSKVNGSIPGSVSLDGLSLGWTSGVSATGLKVYDEQKALILEVPKFSTDLTLLNAIKGNLALGNTTADVNATRIVIDENGVSNVQRAFGLDKPADEPKKPNDKEPKPDEPAELPNVTGNITLNILGGTIEKPSTLPKSIHLQPGTIKADIKDINQPIENSGDLGYRLGDATPAKISWKGKVDIADANKLDIAEISGDESLSLESVDLSALNAFLPPEQQAQLAGLLKGSLQLKGSESDASIVGDFAIADLAVSAAALNGDTYKTKLLSLPIKVTRKTAGNGTAIHIESLGVQSDEVQVALSGDVSDAALTNLAAMKPPGETGALALKVAVPNLAAVVNQLPNTLKLAEGVQITGGALNTNANIALKPDAAVIAYDFSADAKGTRDGKPVTLSPITLNVNGSVIPLGEEKVPQVKDMTLALKSAFATADGNAKSLEAIALNLGFDLSAMQKELSQFVDMGGMNLAGTGKLTLNTNGDVTDPTKPIATTLDLNMQKLTVARTTAAGLTPPLKDEDITAKLAADVVLPEAGGYKATAKTLSLTSGSKLFSVTNVEGKPVVIESPASGPLKATADLKLTADLKRLMDVGQAFAATQPAAPATDAPGQLKSGNLDAMLAVAPDGDQTSLKLDGAINNLTVTTAEKPLENETVKLTVAAKTPADFARLMLDATVDSSFAKLAVSGADIVLSKPDGNGATTAPSTFEMVQNANVSADIPELAKLYAVANAFSPPAPATAPAATSSDPTATPPPPPMQITKGSAKLKMNVKRDGGATKATISDTQIDNLAITRGQATYAFAKPIVVTADSNINSANDAIDKLTVAALNIDLGGIANVKLADPLQVSGFDKDVPTANGTLVITGQIEQLAKLLEAVQGTPDAYPYKGTLALNEKLGTDNSGQLSLVGSGKATDFQTFTPGQEAPTFSEKEIAIDNNLVVDPNAKTAIINALNINMPSSQALQMAVSGKVVDWEKQRNLDKIKLDLTYDLEKLWPIIKPLMRAENQKDLDTLKIAGKTKRTFNISGSYPAVDSSGKELAFNESIKTVNADGGVAVASFDYKGTQVENLEIPFSLRNGRLDTIDSSKKGADRVAKPATCNGGLLNLGGLLVDLTRADGPRLSTGKNHELMKNVTINPLFADSILGKWINPAFVNPDKAQGLLSITLTSCNNLPLSDLLTQTASSNDGSADIKMSIIELALGNELLTKAVSLLAPKAFNNNALNGNIKDARIQIANGIVTEDMTITVDGYPLTFDGKVRLQDQALLPLNLTISPQLISKVGEDVRKFLPASGLSIPLTGTTTSPRFDLGVVTKEIAGAVAKAQIGNLLGGKDKEKDKPKDEKASNDGDTPGAKPVEQKPEDIARDVLEGLLKKRDK